MLNRRNRWLPAGIVAAVLALGAGTALAVSRTTDHAFLTGGLSAAPWARDLDGIDALEPDLTLKGLAILHAEVAGGEPLELGLP